MDDYRQPMMMPPMETEQPAPRGGLASKAIGGLSTFLENVNRGIDVVRSNPLYASVWSGLVSGMAGDPAAGPMAYQALRQSALNQRMQQQEIDSYGKPTIQDELAQLRVDRMRKRDQARDALASKLMQDPRNVSDAEMYAADPDAWVKSRLSPQSVGKPVQVLRDGKPVYVSPADAIGMEPVPRAPLVQNNVGTGMTNATTTKVQGQQLDAQDTLARLDSIRSSFRPEFQQWGAKLGQRWSDLKDSAGVGLSDAEKQQLTDMSSFQANAYENMSRILNQLSGAAISPAEFERLKRFLPNVGSGVFDGDSPTAFQAKLDRFDKSVRQAIKRYEYAQKNGLQSGGFEIPLEQFGVPETVGGAGRSRPDGVPEGSRYDDAGRMWITPDGRVLVED